MPPSTSALQKRTATSGSSSATETTGLICGPTSSPRSCRPLCSCLALSINCVRRCLSLSRRCKALRVEEMIDGGSEAVNMYGRHAKRRTSKPPRAETQKTTTRLRLPEKVQTMKSTSETERAKERGKKDKY